MTTVLTNSCGSKLRLRYSAALARFIEHPDAENLREATGIGQTAVSERLPVKELIAAHAELLHERLLSAAGASDSVRIADRASDFLAESLTAFDTQDVLRNSRAKDEFMSAVSHELRTPLTALLGMSELLRRGALDPERARRAIETICRATENEARIVEDFLDVSRIMMGRLRLDPKQSDLAAIVRRVAHTFRTPADRKEINIDVIIDPESVPIFADPHRLERVLWHLLSNAVKFTPRRGNIQVQLSANENEAEIAVRDTGIGMPAERLAHVFDHFLQVDEEIRNRFGGMGSGLLIVRNIVDLHGGSVRVESPGDDKGTTFTVTLPLKMD
jgi:signal transduction histidine kinase